MGGTTIEVEAEADGVKGRKEFGRSQVKLLTWTASFGFMHSLHRRWSRSGHGQTDFQKVYFHHELFVTDFRSNNYSRLNK